MENLSQYCFRKKYCILIRLAKIILKIPQVSKLFLEFLGESQHRPLTISAQCRMRSKSDQLHAYLWSKLGEFDVLYVYIKEWQNCIQSKFWRLQFLPFYVVNPYSLGVLWSIHTSRFVALWPTETYITSFERSKDTQKLKVVLGPIGSYRALSNTHSLLYKWAKGRFDLLLTVC